MKRNKKLIAVAASAVAIACVAVASAFAWREYYDRKLPNFGKNAEIYVYPNMNSFDVLEELREKCAYKNRIEKARGNLEKREYWQTEDISWLSRKKEWAGLKSIIMTRNTIAGTDGSTTVEERYFISSLSTNIEEAERAVRGHWMIESYHWHLDVPFREDGNHTLEKQASYNLNIIRKLALNMLKILEVGSRPLSMKKKRYVIGTNPEKHLEKIMSL